MVAREERIAQAESHGDRDDRRRRLLEDLTHAWSAARGSGMSWRRWDWEVPIPHLEPEQTTLNNTTGESGLPPTPAPNPPLLPAAVCGGARSLSDAATSAHPGFSYIENHRARLVAVGRLHGQEDLLHGAPSEPRFARRTTDQVVGLSSISKAMPYAKVRAWV